MFEQKVVIVTGSGNGIGKEIALMYARSKAKIVLVDRDEKGLVGVEKMIAELGGAYLRYAIDLRKVDEIEKLVADVKSQFGTIDILINNAGMSRFYSPYEITEEQWDDIIDSNLKGAFFMARECAKVMKEKGGGRIVNIASTRAFMSESGGEAYGSSKGGLIALTHALANSLSEDNILVNAISPGWIHTGKASELRSIDHEQHLAKRVGTSSDIAEACAFLTSPTNSFITGENITIDGGMTKKMIYVD
ncbi:SDR family NAD(P)-dependent oxidoreductase [Aeribacillus kexueae]|uniref:SDR family NAD(P)-dependent oxidoreductase n=1 Tax=Aeribacillus kexueae TaxID=2078952 RepID=UPI003AF03172